MPLLLLQFVKHIVLFVGGERTLLHRRHQRVGRLQAIRERAGDCRWVLRGKARDGAFDRAVDLPQSILEEIRRRGPGKVGNARNRNIDAVEEACFPVLRADVRTETVVIRNLLRRRGNVRPAILRFLEAEALARNLQISQSQHAVIGADGDRDRG